MPLQPIAVESFSTVDKAPLLTPPQDFVFIDGLLVAVQGTPIASHGSGGHASAVTANGTSFVYINGILITRETETASCGHPVENGKSWIRADGA